MASAVFLILQLAALLLITNALPQQNSDLEDTIKGIFSTDPQPPRSSGFDQIVQPEPVDPSLPQTNFNSVSGKPQCNCVPYHMCDPTNNNQSSTDDGGEFDGYGLIDIRFNSDDPICEHFLDVCCSSANAAPEKVTTPKPQEQRPNRPTGCGIRNVGGIDFQIVGANDNEAGFGEFPWTVALLHSNLSYFCTGSLIHPRVVLTAAHCVINKPANSFVIRAGEWDTQTTRERLPYEERNVESIITHPQYNPRNVAFDFALVVLAQAVTIGDHINVVCLPGQNAVPNPGTTCFSTGWGKDVFGAAGRFSVIMKRVPLPIVEFGSCQTQFRSTRLGPKFGLDRSFLCAGGVRGIDTCQGDGGAPLVCPIGIESQNRYHQSGIVAWGIGCKDNIPAAYASVAVARNWIDQQMNSRGFGTISYSAI